MKLFVFAEGKHKYLLSHKRLYEIGPVEFEVLIGTRMFSKAWSSTAPSVKFFKVQFNFIQDSVH